MNTERSLKDIRILQAAFSALIFVLMVRLAIVPAYEKHQEMQQEHEAAEDMLAEMQGYLDREPANEARLAAAEEQFQELAASYYPLMESQELDSLITGIALRHNLFPVALSISTQTSGIPEAYLYAVESGAGAGDASGAADTGDAAGDTDADEDGSAGDTADAGDMAAGQTDAAAGAASPDASLLENAGEMVKEAQVSLTVSGAADDVEEMLDDLEKNYPAIRLCSFQRTENVYMDEEMETVREQRVNFVLAVSMYEE